MENDKSNWKEAGATPKILTGIIAIVIVSMLTIGMAITQQQNSQVQKQVAKQQTTGQANCEGSGWDYCSIAHQGITCTIAGMDSGEYDFSELQAYIDANGVPSAQPAQPIIQQGRISFGAIGVPGTPIPGQGRIKSDTSTPVVYFNVEQRLRELLPQGEAYCQGSVPAGWQFHTEALCLAAAMSLSLSVCMVTGIVSSFFALFGEITHGAGLIFWTLLLRGFGIIDPQMIDISVQIYQTCMGLLG